MPNYNRLSGHQNGCTKPLQIGLTITYRASTTFPVVKTCLANIYIGFLVVKHIFPGITILLFSQTCKVLEQALQKSRRLCWIYKFCGTQSNFVEPLQAFNWLGNGHLQALIDFAVVKTYSTIIVRHSTGFMVIKICILFRYSHSIGFAVIKTGLLNPYSPSTGNAVLKTVLLILYRLSKQAWQSTTDSPILL